MVPGGESGVAGDALPSGTDATFGLRYRGAAVIVVAVDGVHPYAL